MAKPLGTGIFFNHKDKKYVVNKVENGRDYGVFNYIGIIGKVVNIIDGKVWVKTEDNVVLISEIECEGEIINPSEVFRNGMTLQ